MPAARRLPARRAGAPLSRRSLPPAARGSRAPAPRAVVEGSSYGLTQGLQSPQSRSYSAGLAFLADGPARAQTSGQPRALRTRRRTRRDLLQEARAVGQATDTAQVREGPARAEVDAGANVRPGDDERHVLPRMIGARRRRIVAVVGCDDQHVVVPQLREEPGQAGVEPFEVPRVAFHVVAMAVLGVEVDEVREEEPALDSAH